MQENRGGGVGRGGSEQFLTMSKYIILLSRFLAALSSSRSLVVGLLVRLSVGPSTFVKM